MFARLQKTFQSGLNSAVAATRDGVNRALPGNPALRDYDVGEQVGTGGTNGAWDIYNAVKKSSKTKCSVWIFDKNRHLNGFDKNMKENVLNILKHGALSLCRLQHPRILSVERRLEESAYSLVFVTERIQGSVDYLLSKREVETDSSSGLFDVELRYGLLQICEALSFLHDSAKLFHCNLNPLAIAVTDKGSWKLAGLEFSTKLDDDNFKWADNYPTLAQPCPSYIPPDLFENKIIDTSVDSFAFGVLLYKCYAGQTIIDCSVYDAQRVLQNEKGKYTTPSLLHRLPSEVRDHFKMLTSLQKDLRPSADQLRSISFFQSAGALTLHYLDTLLQRPLKEKEQFFSDLPAVLDTLPARVRNGIVISSLQPEIANANILPSLLPPVFKIVELATGEEFYDKILPVIKDLFNTQSAKACSIMIENLPLMLEKLSEAKKPDDVRNYLLPLLGRALAQEKQTNLQAQSLAVIPQLAEHLDEATLKSNLVPKIKSAALSESCSGPVKVSILVAIGQLLPRLDRWFIMDSILDWVPKMIERTPGVLIAVLGVYHVVLMDDKLGMTKEFIANNALPTLLPLSMDSSLSLNQFQNFMKVIRTMLDKIEQEQTNKLKSISDVKGENISHGVSLSAIRGASGSTGDAGNSSSIPLGGFDGLSLATSAVSPAPSNGIGISKDPSKGLSLEQKQEELKRRENEVKIKSQPQLFKQTKSEQKPQKKDLTSTLMTKNLSNMTSTNNGAGFGAFGTGNNMAQNTTMMSAGNMMGSSSFGNINTMSGSNMGNMGSSMGSGNIGMGGGIRPLSNQPAIMPSNMSTSASFGNGFNQSIMSNSMGQSSVIGQPMGTNQNSGWTLQNPMTPQGVTIPTNNTATGAKKLTAAELADFLG